MDQNYSEQEHKSFLSVFLTEGWNSFTIGTPVTIAAYLLIEKPIWWTTLHTWFIFIELGTIALLFKILKQFYQCHNRNFFPRSYNFYVGYIPVEAVRNGEGCYEGKKIICFSKRENIPVDSLLTLYSSANGLYQAIHILKVIEVDDELIQTILFDKVDNNIMQYSQEHLFANTIIRDNTLNWTKSTIQRRKSAKQVNLE